MVHGINDMTAMELDARSILFVKATEVKMWLTKRPSASHWFKGNMTLKIVVAASESRSSSYPTGPGGDLSLPGNSRLLMYWTDKRSAKSIPMGIVKNKNRETVWATSAHRIPFLIGWAGLSNVAIH